MKHTPNVYRAPDRDQGPHFASRSRAPRPSHDRAPNRAPHQPEITAADVIQWRIDRAIRRVRKLDWALGTDARNAIEQQARERLLERTGRERLAAERYALGCILPRLFRMRSAGAPLPPGALETFHALRAIETQLPARETDAARRCALLGTMHVLVDRLDVLLGLARYWRTDAPVNEACRAEGEGAGT